MLFCEWWMIDDLVNMIGNHCLGFLGGVWSCRIDETVVRRDQVKAMNRIKEGFSWSWNEEKWDGEGI